MIVPSQKKKKRGMKPLPPAGHQEKKPSAQTIAEIFKQEQQQQ